MAYLQQHCLRHNGCRRGQWEQPSPLLQCLGMSAQPKERGAVGADYLLKIHLHIFHASFLSGHTFPPVVKNKNNICLIKCPPAGRNALHIDVHMGPGFIYWCDFSSTVAGQNGVRRIKPDGSGLRSVITSGIGRNGIRGIAVDWAAGRLAFTVSSIGFVWLNIVSPVILFFFVWYHLLITHLLHIKIS